MVRISVALCYYEYIAIHTKTAPKAASRTPGTESAHTLSAAFLLHACPRDLSTPAASSVTLAGPKAVRTMSKDTKVKGSPVTAPSGHQTGWVTFAIKA